MSPFFWSLTAVLTVFGLSIIAAVLLRLVKKPQGSNAATGAGNPAPVANQPSPSASTKSKWSYLYYGLYILPMAAVIGSIAYVQDPVFAIVEIAIIYFAITYILGGLEVYKEKASKYTKMIFYAMTVAVMVCGVLILIFGIDLSSQFFTETINGVRRWADSLLNPPNTDTTPPDYSSWLLYGSLAVLVAAAFFSGSEKKK
jgi:cytochrome b561